jgi:predicted dehydrogenase
MDTIKIAVAGAGRRAQSHLNAISRMTDRYRLVGVCDLEGARAEEAAGRYGGTAYTHPLAMLEAARPDLLTVVVPPEGHHVLACAAAERGVHVISETPFAISLPCVDLMIQAAREHGVKLEVSENVWRFSRERLKRAIIEAGWIGEPTQFHLQYTSGSYHGMNAIRTLLGAEGRRVVGMAGEVPLPDGRDALGRTRATGSWEAALLEFDRGITGIYEQPVGWGGNRWEISGTRGRLLADRLSLPGEDGRAVELPFETETVEVNGEKVVSRLRVNTDPPVVWESPFARYGAAEDALLDMLTAMHRAITEDVEPGYGAENARRDQELLMALRESALLGSQPVELPLRGVTRHETLLHQTFHDRYGCDPLDAGAAVGRLFPSSW